MSEHLISHRGAESNEQHTLNQARHSYGIHNAVHEAWGPPPGYYSRSKAVNPHQEQSEDLLRKPTPKEPAASAGVHRSGGDSLAQHKDYDFSTPNRSHSAELTRIAQTPILPEPNSVRPGSPMPFVRDTDDTTRERTERIVETANFNFDFRKNPEQAGTQKQEQMQRRGLIDSSMPAIDFASPEFLTRMARTSVSPERFTQHYIMEKHADWRQSEIVQSQHEQMNRTMSGAAHSEQLLDYFKEPAEHCKQLEQLQACPGAETAYGETSADAAAVFSREQVIAGNPFTEGWKFVQEQYAKNVEHRYRGQELEKINSIPAQAWDVACKAFPELKRLGEKEAILLMKALIANELDHYSNKKDGPEDACAKAGLGEQVKDLTIGWAQITPEGVHRLAQELEKEVKNGKRSGDPLSTYAHMDYKHLALALEDPKQLPLFVAANLAHNVRMYINHEIEPDERNLAYGYNPDMQFDVHDKKHEHPLTKKESKSLQTDKAMLPTDDVLGKSEHVANVQKWLARLRNSH